MASRLVCAVVGSAPHDSAVALASRVADALHLRLELVDVRAPLGPMVAPPLGGAGLVQAMDVADHGMREPPTDLAGLAERTRVRPEVMRSVEGDPVQELVRLSELASTALLVVADSGHGRVWSWLAQEASREALREVACPIMLVRASPAPRRPRTGRVVAAVRADAAAPFVTDVAVELATALETPLELVNAEPRPHDDQPPPVLAECARRVPPAIDVTITVGEATVTAVLARVVDEHPSAMLVLGAPDHGLLGSAVLGSAAHWVLAECPNPVVIVPDRGRHTTGDRWVTRGERPA